MMLNDFPSHRSTTNEANIPMMTSALEIATAIGDSSGRGRTAKLISRNVPSNAERRGSIPAALRTGRNRVMAVAATRARNRAVDARAKMCSPAAIKWLMFPVERDLQRADDAAAQQQRENQHDHRSGQPVVRRYPSHQQVVCWSIVVPGGRGQHSMREGSPHCCHSGTDNGSLTLKIGYLGCEKL
jgi:hypothetical protein